MTPAAVAPGGPALSRPLPAYGRLARREAGRDLLLAFNYRVAEWARSDRLKAMNPVLERLVGPGPGPRPPKVCRWITRWILEEWNLEEPYCLELKGPRERLWLLAPGSLEGLAEQAGLLLHARVMQLCIERPRRQALVEAIGRERREFAVSRYPLYARRLAALEGAAAGAPGWSLEAIRRDGWRCLLACLEPGAPEAFRRRVELKLPPDVALPADGNNASGDDATVAAACLPADGAWGLVERILRLERPGEWTLCCC